MKKKTLQLKNSYQNCEEIQNIKENISKLIKNKIIKSFTPKENLNKKFSIESKAEVNTNTNKKSINLNDECDSGEDEMIDDVKENDIKLNRNLKKCVTEKSAFKKPVMSKRVSRGYIGDIKFNENSKEN